VKRALERSIRARAVAFARWARRQGLSLRQAADRLGLAVRTLRRWRARWRQERLRARGRGRPAHRADRALRMRVLALLELLGPRVGVRPLQALCPGLARREVADLLRRYRRAWRRRRDLRARRLHWARAGTVWAIDFSEPPQPVEGCYAQLLAVRDQASGYQLAWLPTADESADTAAAALAALFREHGAPLVLKSDNGSAFISGAAEALLAAWGVVPLFSPPRTPRYNGACEAGIGSMKARTHHEAAARGRPGEWTCDDAEAARRQANETARPHGLRGPTPEEAWHARAPLPPEERAAFVALAARLEAEARREQGYPAEGNLSRTAQAAVRRVAVRRALEALGLLSIRAGRGPAPAGTGDGRLGSGREMAGPERRPGGTAADGASGW
jgi:transposase InsO family protein